MVKLPDEFYDVVKVLEHGLDKGYAEDGWLAPDGPTMDVKSQAGSMQRHLSKALYGDVMGNKIDTDSGLHHALHLACRALMLYTRYRRGVQHPKDGRVNIKFQRAGRLVRHPKGDFHVED